MNIIEKYPSNVLSEIQHGMKEARFALIDDKTGEAIMPFVRCKDYFSDLFWSYYTGKSGTCCGFAWSPNNHKTVLDREYLTVAIKITDRFSDDKNDITNANFEGVKALLLKFNQSLKFNKSTVIISDDNKYLIVKVDKKWVNIPYIQSTLFFILRLGLTYKPNTDVIESYNNQSNFISPNDALYWKTSKHIIKKLLKGEIDENDVYTRFKDMSNAHCQLGIVSYSQRNKL